MKYHKISYIIRAFLLLPLSLLWEAIYRMRRTLYNIGIMPKNFFQIPIISVGNVTFGGTGKTPIIAWLSNYYADKGLNPAVLTRGYKGKLEHGSGLIVKGQRFKTNPVEYGDEPLLLSRKLKKGAVIVGKKRARNLRKYLYELQPDVVLLDDGFQHLNLYRSFNIVLFDATLPLDRYRVAPLGYLREGMSALKDADAILISRSDKVSVKQLEALKKLLLQFCSPNIPFAHIKYRPNGVFGFNDEKAFKAEQLKGKKVIAMAAIASPHSFFSTLEECGADIIEKLPFDDHHFFTREELQKIIDKSLESSAIVLTSEKDMVKIKKVISHPNIYFLNIDVVFTLGKDKFLERLSSSVRL